jgi:regulatory protein
VPGSPRLIVSSPSALLPPVPEGPATLIKELRESPRTPGRYIVLLSTGEQCVVGIDTLAALGATRVGVALDSERVAQLLRAGAVTALVDRALNSLAHGRRTRRELETKLRRVQPDLALIAEALDRLEANGVLSDVEVARAEASARLRRGEAPARVRQNLRRKGIDARGTEAAIADAIDADGFDELSACRQQAQKRARALSSLEPMVARRRLTAYLLRRGFGGRAVRTVVEEILGR